MGFFQAKLSASGFGLELGVPVTSGMKVGVKKLEFLGYPMVKGASS